MRRRYLAPASLHLAACAVPAVSAPKKGPLTAWVTTKDGRSLEGMLATESLQVSVDGRTRALRLRDVLSIQTGDPASPQEADRIKADLAAVQGTDRAARDAATAELTDLGLAALSPLLATYKDTDAREPNPLLRLFPRLVPGYADAPDRSLDLVRLSNGEAWRGDVQSGELKLSTADGKTVTVPVSDVRRLAVRQAKVERTFDIEALKHCTQIEFLDTGVAVTPDSHVEETAAGYARLSFDIDGWSCDPDGLKKPGPNYKTNLVDGFPFGALVGKVGPAGSRWFAGRSFDKQSVGRGRLFFAINDNGHWQNNVGSYRVKLKVTDAYDLGDAQ